MSKDLFINQYFYHLYHNINYNIEKKKGKVFYTKGKHLTITSESNEIFGKEGRDGFTPLHI